MRMMVDGLFIRATSMGAPGVDEIQWRKPVLVGDRSAWTAKCWTRGCPRGPDRGFVRFRFTMTRDEEKRKRRARDDVRLLGDVQTEDRGLMWFEDFPLNVKITLGSYTFTEENIIAFAQALRSAAVPYRQGGGAALVLWRIDRERLAYGGGVDEADDGLSRRACRGGRGGHAVKLRLARRARVALAEAGAAGNDAHLHERAVRQARLGRRARNSG